MDTRVRSRFGGTVPVSADPTTTDFAPTVRECPACGAVCKRHSAYTRAVRDISLDGPVVLNVRVGNYWCRTCERFHKPDVPFAPKGRRYTNRAVRKATVSVQEDRTTYTALPHRMERDFAIRPSKSTGWAWFQEYAGDIDIADYLRWACERFSGQLSVDSIEDKGSHLWFATDPLNSDLILGYLRCDSPNGESLTAFLTTLRDDYRINPALFTCDGAAAFDKVPQQVWPEAQVQLCHFHVLRALMRGYLRHSLADRLRAYKPVKPVRPGRGEAPKRSRGRGRHQRGAIGHATPEYRAARAQYDRDHGHWVETFRKRRLFFKRLDSPTPDADELQALAFVAGATERYRQLRMFREFMVGIYGIMGCRDAVAAEATRQNFIARWEVSTRDDKHLAAVVEKFRDDKWFAKLFPFTAFANAHRTTNSTERANRWFRKRQKSHYRLRKEHTIRNMLHADLIYRRSRSPLTGPERLRPKSTPPAMAA
jgi:hypothetical protein